MDKELEDLSVVPLQVAGTKGAIVRMKFLDGDCLYIRFHVEKTEKTAYIRAVELRDARGEHFIEKIFMANDHESQIDAWIKNPAAGSP